MNSKALEPYLDPELRAVYRSMPDPGLDLADPLAARERSRANALSYQSRLGPVAGVSIADRMVEREGGRPPLRVRLYAPQEGPTSPSALLWIHGGGFVVGAPENDEALLSRWALALGCVIAAPAYRLAPEHPHPVPVEDCFEAWAWLTRSAGDLGIDASRIALGGASAGGGLAAALALYVRDRGAVAPCFQLLICPMLDDRCETRSMIAIEDSRVFNGPQCRNGWRALLGAAQGGADVSPYAAPARASDLSGLPPAFILASTLDPLADEDVAYAQRLMQDGVPTELHLYPGGFHAFQVIAPNASMSRRAQEEILGALRRALNEVT